MRGGGNDFLAAYEDNIEKQGEEIVQNNTLIMTILNEMNKQDEWVGTMKSVYLDLRERANPDKNDPTFPRTERSLRNHLERAKTTLIQKGITFTIGLRTEKGIPITFRKGDFQEDEQTSSFDTFGTQKASHNVDDEVNEHDSGTSWNDDTEITSDCADGPPKCGKGYTMKLNDKTRGLSPWCNSKKEFCWVANR